VPALFRKDCLWFLLLTVGFSSTAILYTFGSVDGTAADSRIVFQIAMLQIGLVGFSLFSSELRESYRFLQTLPVSATEIVVSKFMLVLAQVALYWGLVLMLLSSAGWSSSEFAFAIGVVNTCAILSLLLAATWYWGIFRFGFSLASKAFAVFCFCALIVLILVAETIEGRMAEWQVTSLSPGRWIFIIAVALVGYYLMMRLAIRAKISGEADQ